MVKKNLVEYFEDGISKGLPVDYLKEKLKGQGWNKNEVNSAANYVSKTSLGGYTSFFSRVKRMMILVGAGLVAIILIIYFFAFSFNRLNLSEVKWKNGVSYLMESELINIKFRGFDNEFMIQSFDSEKITFRLNGKIEVLELGDPRPFDLSYDGVKETIIQVEVTIGGRPKFFIKEYTECIEEWVCGSWTFCKSSVKTRECLDENNCGTTNDRPKIEEPCQGILDLPLN
jgi:hypothetical protein